MKTVNMKKFFIFGTLVDLQGETKIRWVNTYANIKTYEKQGHSDPMMIENDVALNKYESVKFMLTLPEFQQEDRYNALASWLEKNEKDYVAAMGSQSQDNTEETEVDEVEETTQLLDEYLELA